MAAIIHGNLISVLSVGVVSAEFCGVQKYFIAYLPPLLRDYDVGRVVFLRVQPKVVGVGFAKESIVL